MARKTRRVRVDRERARDYAAVADKFFEAADVAREFEYWTPAGVLLVHASIAYADAISIGRLGQKSASEAHQDAVALLKEAIPGDRGLAGAVTHLTRIIAEKNRLSYGGLAIRKKDLEPVWTNARRFRNWAKSLLP